VLPYYALAIHLRSSIFGTNAGPFSVFSLMIILTENSENSGRSSAVYLYSLNESSSSCDGSRISASSTSILSTLSAKPLVSSSKSTGKINASATASSVGAPAAVTLLTVT